jgi:hypothetical protein
MQYSCQGDFNMIPMKLIPNFEIKYKMNKIEIQLNLSCRLGGNQRLKKARITF